MPHSLEGVIARATEAIRTTGAPDFEPKIDPKRLAELPAWPIEPFEIIQKGTGEGATFQLRLRGLELEPWRQTPEEVARDLKTHGGERPAYIDRTGPECVTADARRIGWGLLKDLP